MVLADPGPARAFLSRYGPVLTVPWAAQLAGVSVDRIYQLVDLQGRLCDVRFLGQRGVLLHEFEEWLDSPGRLRFRAKRGAR